MGVQTVQVRSIRDFAVIALAATALLWATNSGALADNDGKIKKGRAPIDGNYKLKFAVYGNGDGVATVAADTVTITGTIDDDGGKKQPFVATGLKIVNYRFVGPGTVGGLDLQVSGRIDPMDETLRTQRITAVFRDANGKAGKIVGSIPGKKPKE